MRWLRARRSWHLSEGLERTLCCIFSCVVDVLTVIPVARGYQLACNLDGAAPGSPAACSVISRASHQVTMDDGPFVPLLSETTCHAGGRMPLPRQKSVRRSQRLRALLVSGDAY